MQNSFAENLLTYKFLVNLIINFIQFAIAIFESLPTNDGSISSLSFCAMRAFFFSFFKRLKNFFHLRRCVILTNELLQLNFAISLIFFRKIVEFLNLNIEKKKTLDSNCEFIDFSQRSCICETNVKFGG